MRFKNTVEDLILVLLKTFTFIRKFSFKSMNMRATTAKAVSFISSKDKMMMLSICFFSKNKKKGMKFSSQNRKYSNRKRARELGRSMTGCYCVEQ